MEICQKVLENLSMVTVQKMGMSLPKVVRKFVNGYSAEITNTLIIFTVIITVFFTVIYGNIKIVERCLKNS